MSDLAESEALLRSLSTEATILRTTYGPAQTVGRDVTTAMAAGILAAPAGQARTAPAHLDDLAEATARVLTSDQHRDKLYTLTASDSIDWTDLAALAATTTGKPILGSVGNPVGGAVIRQAEASRLSGKDRFVGEV
jgi:NAD(P)H dehydrogenase (quinone)